MTHEAGRASPWPRRALAVVAAVALLAAACRSRREVAAPAPSAFTIGYGLASGQVTEMGLRQQLTLIEREGLLGISRDGRPRPWLAESWDVSPDGLRVRLQLKPHVRFHDGTALTATLLARFLTADMPAQMGSLFDDVAEIRALSERDLEFVLRRRSSFLVEALEIAVKQPDSNAGTGPFQLAHSSAGEQELVANTDYWGGKPNMDRILVKTYPSVRSAWADMLRGQVDMLYEVGADALASLEASQDVQLFTFQRSYSYEVVLNTRKPELRSGEIRRQLNRAIDRQALVSEGLGGHGRPTDSPLWPLHWAYDPRLPTFTYQPVRLEKPLAFTCLFADAALERLALATQKQLAAIGVDMKLERLPLDQFSARFVQGDFDAILGDMLGGPSMFRSYLLWHSAGAWNYGHFNSARVDLALDTIREAADDDTYRAGVAAYQQAMVDDPPAIFLAWSERARAVSTRFDVHAEPGRDILSTLRLWTPVSTHAAATAH